MNKGNETEENRSEAGVILDKLKAVMGDGTAPEGQSPVPASSIRVEQGLFQMRVMVDHHIKELAGIIKAHGTVEPLLVILVGGVPYLLDGHHRLDAYKRAGKTDAIPVHYFRGTLDEAVLESGAANTAVKLIMNVKQRGDYAWRLTLLGTYSKPQIAKSSGASTSSVGLMRKAKEALGSTACDYTEWAKARRAAQGKGMLLTEKEIEDMKERTASEWTNRLHQIFGSKMVEQPEIAAKALSNYFGRRLDEVVKELKDQTGDAVWEDVEDQDY